MSPLNSQVDLPLSRPHPNETDQTGIPDASAFRIAEALGFLPVSG
jgi:hypothetical protein